MQYKHECCSYETVDKNIVNKKVDIRLPKMLIKKLPSDFQCYNRIKK